MELKDRSPAVAMGVGGHDDHLHLHNHHDHDHHHHDEHGPGGAGGGETQVASKVLTRNEALGGMDRNRSGAVTCDPIAFPSVMLNGAGTGLGSKRSAPASPAASAVANKKAKTEGSDSEADEKVVTGANGSLTRQVRLTRPWKSVYCERLLVERNWRKGRCTTKTLKVSATSVACGIIVSSASLTSRAIPTASCVCSITPP